MLRRLYLEFPDRNKAEAAVEDLQAMGIQPQHIHTVAAAGIDISGLPPATVRQRTDATARVEQLFWNLNLGLFVVALLAFVVALTTQAWGAAIAMLLVMSASFLVGNHFATHVPRIHLDQFAALLRHGDILLLVDVPLWRVSKIESELQRHHPAMIFGGLTWTSEALHI